MDVTTEQGEIGHLLFRSQQRMRNVTRARVTLTLVLAEAGHLQQYAAQRFLPTWELRHFSGINLSNKI